ncbi:hypothetical protein GCM10023156_05110 [Novipirellula rosea]|uniref:Uncharacterized protein n=1 Tax=Novipirellula rosea TaxID=1031540 RepID=A0ABP8M984_9BACT
MPHTLSDDERDSFGSQFEIASRCLSAYASWSRETLHGTEWCDSEASRQLESIAKDIEDGRLASAFTPPSPH